MRAEAIFYDRRDAGKQLGELVRNSVGDTNSLVLALPRGGVPVGFEVARALGSELDVFLVRKLGLPGQEELAIGAIASGGIRVLNQALIRELQLSRKLIDQITAREAEELNRREELYRSGQRQLVVRDHTVVLVDDGLATGATMKAASRAIRSQEPRQIVIAVPVGARQTCDELRQEGNEVACVATPEPFIAVGVWYQDFTQTSDAEVRVLLAEARQHFRQAKDPEWEAKRN